jgi:two-component system sensor histidine kinase PilS (NtrC family)
MGLPDRSTPDLAASRRLKILMLARVLIVTLLLGASALVQMSEKDSLFVPPTNAYYLLIGFTCLLTIVYALALRRIRNLEWFAFGQIFFDTVFITFLIYLTGGVESLLSLAYILSIISAGLVLSRVRTYVIASLSSVLYGASLILEYHDIVHPLTASGGYFYSSMDILFRIFVYVLAFFIVAALVNHLGEKVRTTGKELRQKQLDYQKLEAFHQNIVQSLDSGLMTTDPSGRISFLNKTAYRILGIDPESSSPEELDGLLSDHLVNLPTDSAAWEKLSGREETIFERSDGETIHLGLSRSPLRDIHGVLVGSILIFQDITRIKEMEEQIKFADRMVSIGQMAAGIAHEIRNPLASLMGSIQVLKEEMDPSQGDLNLMNIVIRESERLNKLVSDFLLFAHPPRNEFAPVLLNTLIDETLQVLENSPQFNGHIVISRVFSDKAGILGDANQLKQVLWNLFLNAVQEMEDGGHLRIGLKHEEKSVKLTVSDTGTGIDRQRIGKIFEPFFTTKESGTGLGLAIVHRIIESHGGTIQVESECGRGTSFILTFPEMNGV